RFTPSASKIPMADSKSKEPNTQPQSSAQTEVANGGAASRADRYDPQAIEQKWSERWAQNPDLYRAEPSTSAHKKYYVLEMLPYPSGKLHMGHVRNYAIGDALARYMWMQGHNVLHPMGWDAFGLPAENAAIQNQTPPRQWTLQNIASMKAQMKRLGFAYDWSKELATCLPQYYRWNQWFFLKFFEQGLAYRKKSKVNWCPECATVLANEQVLPNGCCWRHENTPVEQRELEQWFLRTTKYADELLQGFDTLQGWPEKVRTMQRNWIGRSEGTLVDFKLDGAAGPAGDKISVFTTRVDTIYGATSLQLAPEHPLVTDLIANDPDLLAKVEELIAEQRKAKEVGDIGAIEKHGVSTERFALNPFNGEQVPIWVANYVLLDYGTGAIMSVPAHDERDYEFAKKYGLDIRVVILPRRDGDERRETDEPVLPFTEMDSLVMNSGEYSGLPCQEAIVKMSKFAEAQGFGKATVTYRLKDWGISRQRYWGTPIPMIYCADCGIVPVPEKDLPVLLPDNVNITLAGEVRRPGAPRDRHHGYVRRFVLVLLSLHRSRSRQQAARLRHCGILVSHRSIHRRSRTRHPAPHLFALLDQGDARHGPGEEFRACGPAVHPGHGDQGRGQDVEEPGQRGVARRHGRALRRGLHAHVHAVRLAARPRSRLAGCRRGRHQPISVAGVPVGNRKYPDTKQSTRTACREQARAGSTQSSARTT